MDSFRQDLRTSVRMLRRAPGVTAVVILSLALATGACTTVLCLVWSLLLHPLPFAEPAALRVVATAIPANGSGGEPDLYFLSFPDFQDVRAQARTFAGVEAYFDDFGLTLTGGAPERVKGALVTAGLFPLLGVEPLLGRQIRAEDDRPGAANVILLGYSLWHRRFAGDPAIVGKTIMSNSLPFRVIGVMPPGFTFPRGNEAWIPALPQAPAVNDRSVRRLSVVARLRPGVSEAAARRDVAALARRLADGHAEAGWRLAVVPLRRWLLGETLRRSLLGVLAAVVAVLLVACANLSNLFLTQTLKRRSEIALRAALGAGPGRIARQLLTEGFLLALAAGVLAVPCGMIGVQLARGVLPQLPYGLVPTAGPAAAVIGLMVSLAAGLLLGLQPSLHAARTDLATAFRHRAPERRSAGPLHAVLVVAEVALATVLLIAASLALRTLVALRAQGAPAAPDHLLTVWVQLSGDRYDDPEARARQLRTIAGHLAALPGFASAAGSDFVPQEFVNGPEVRIETAEGAARGGQTALCHSITSGFFRTWGAPLLAGRALSEDEASTRSSAAVVNATLAHSLWPHGPAVGRRFQLTGGAIPGWLTVVGVAADFKARTLREPNRPQLFISAAYNRFRPAAVLVRTRRPIGSSLAALRRAIHEVDPDLPLFNAATLDDLRAAHLRPESLSAAGLAVFGLTALLIAAGGTYSILAMEVARRRREIAIRLALGARRGHLFRRLVGRGLALTLAGLALGLILALALSRTFAAKLYGVSPADPVSFGGVTILLLDLAFAASYLPARRALEVAPAEALSEE
jgi:predicted permease